MTPAATGPGSPLIAGGAMSGGDYNDFTEDELASNFFDLSNSPDTLQTFDSLSDTKAFLSPQDLNGAQLPDSPNGSYQDSSSESASSKRSISSKMAINPAEVMMDDDDVKVEWGRAPSDLHNFGDDDTAFAFGRSHGDLEMYDFGQHDSFYDNQFPFQSSSSPAVTNGENLVTSPQMPTIHSKSPKEPTPKRKKTQGHHKAQSQYSVSSAMNALNTSTSREVSPMSNMVMSHGGSPAPMFNSPSPNNQMDFSRAMNGGMGHHMWPNKMDVTAQPAPDVLPMQFGGQMNQPLPMSQQMPMPTPFGFTGRYDLTILPTPLKSRVETQIPIKMALSPMPPGVTKLHLPAHTISKPKLLHKPAPLEKSPDTLELHVSLVCTSAMDAPGRREAALKRAASHPQGYLPPMDDGENGPQHGGDVRICQGCITRERKRAARKKIKKPEEEKIWLEDEQRRVIVFNTNEVKEWQPVNSVVDPSVPGIAMQVDAPMRIACYCRHHSEKMGFNVIFTIKDYQDRVIAQAMSNPIMITDDHKTHPIAQATAQQQQAISEAPVPASLSQTSIDASALLPPTPNGAFCMSPSNGDLSSMHRSSQVSYQSSVSSKTTPTGATSRAISRPASPTSGGPMSKKRKSSASRITPSDLTMTRMNTSASPGAQPAQMPSSATSPYTNNLGAFSQAESLFAQTPMTSFTTGPPTPNGNDQPGFFNNNRSASMDNLAMAQLYSAPASGHPSRAPSPNGLRNGVANNPQNQFTQALTSSLYTVPVGMNQTRPPPIIHKIIPNEGPKVGGIEVTVLGAAFFQGLEVWFGDQKATTTTFWGDSSLVCLLPPSPVAGAVPVTFNRLAAQAPQTFPMGKQPPFFKYVDDNEDKLIRIALSVLGNKMSGNMMDIKDMARRILDDSPSAWSGGASSGPSSGGQMYSHAPHAHLESQLLKCLDLIDLDDSQHRTRLDLRRSTGHTMLHLACSLGYHRFVAALLARGANPNARDKGGFTPLHIAAIHNQAEVVRRLMLNGADPTLRSVSNLSAADVAQLHSVVKTIRRSERHVRSRSSGGSIRSRASSAASLHSLWEPLTKVHTHDEPISPDSSEESPEYTSGDFEDEDPDEDAYLSMRRPSGFRHDQQRPNLRRQKTGELEEEMAPPATAMAAASAALKDHFQQQLHQFQQSIAVQFQNLPHFPQMPQMPALPDYQAPFMRRVQQFMPGMTGPRPEGEQPQRWWDSSPKASAPAPPAYEEIYPQDQLDRKQASAATAAAEAAADQKCAALFDQTTTNETTTVAVQEATDATEVTEVAETKTEELGILKIGRKNAITKEQQEQFRRAHEVKMKRISSDHNLFFIWIPLLLVMICAMLYSYFPWLFTFAWAFIRSLYQNGLNKTQQLIQQNIPERVVEV
ncbi:spt23-suppressor of ty retrotransposon [Fusarium heterosporum]|uniref:Spt23-suppressor of ty retrotransposon n=1 Tax=Fusarium heterosporum TaxID=42747 RepID=A0A8H5WK46_FUSHE|nr:spt23-suppressor of ty retrotransposon [Fusarium heterosporum]